MAAELVAAPVLSTPDDNIIEVPAAESILKSTLSDEELRSTFEIARTAKEILEGGWKRIALQFPDHMLVDAPRVVQALEVELSSDAADKTKRIHILADTSYSACCVDEIAAEHVDSDVVVHYGRTCLSPTSRLPVIYVYTSHELNHDLVVEKFEAEFSEKASNVVFMADLTYQDHVDVIVSRLRTAGYTNVLGTTVERNPAATIPNRKISGPEMTEEMIKTHSLFHISDPPTSLLLALQTRFASLHVLSTSDQSALTVDDTTLRASGLLYRRFSRVLALASAGVVGILVNTLSVSNYMESIDLLRKKISKAGKKSYTIVVGKLNPAKLLNFPEIEGWVVVGCWESGLVEDDGSYWKPVVTPFEMEVALMSDEERTWGAEWWGGIEKLKEDVPRAEEPNTLEQDDPLPEVDGGVEGEESLPPQFDWLTGQLVSHSRPMHLTVRSAKNAAENQNDGTESPSEPNVVAKKFAGDLVSINGVASPGAEYLRSKRTWQGLGSDFDQEASTLIEEGRSGVARGYHVGEDQTRH
ncbi:Diphthamide biosynthesis protein 2 [Conoideocrella luteorostrata]|uniref:2-(3-amino-3-carboxypropyl)histidine synthase subunit 2 n=1 Tax=Conoideocrella luteorostrata TaxID=1105319 RepID=A0AAJ0G2N0_9HYPO|nr:Diphthamide biosynthesis protein 2 [Conoideocrella luteorostrata]